MGKIKTQLLSEELKQEFKVSKKHFTRVRKQTFDRILLLMLNMLRKSLAVEIENFLSFLGHRALTPKLTKSAFVQARKKIRPEVFKHLSNTLVREFYTDNDLSVKKWRGFRLLAVDGSTITLPITQELKAYYGEAKNQSATSIVQARSSILYDISNKYVLDGILAPLKQGERELALKHLCYCQEGDLLIYDRGYPAYDFIHRHIEQNLDYLIRVKVNFNQTTLEFEQSKKKSQVVCIYPSKNAKLSDKPYSKNNPIKVRLVRVDLPKGNVEILMTSLLNAKVHPNKIFKDLYNKRWSVETFYDELKNKLKVEHFSGYSNQSILQDFYTALFVSNVQTLIESDLQEELQQQNETRKYDYKINTNLSYGFLKNRIVGLFFDESSMEKAVKELKTLFMEHQVPIRPNRSFVRNSGKFRSRIKPKITKNQKDSL